MEGVADIITSFASYLTQLFEYLKPVIESIMKMFSKETAEEGTTAESTTAA